MKRLVLPVLGISTTFEASDPVVLSAFEKLFRGWTDLVRTPPPDRSALVRVVLIDGPGPSGEAVEYRTLPGQRTRVHGPGLDAIADPDSRRALVRLTRGWLGRRETARDVLEAVTLSLLAALDRTPFHAAAVVRGGRALLLAGPSGVGKSTLSYAAVREGYELLAEDHVNLQFRGGLRVWGLSPFLHLPPEARSHFPELERVEPSLIRGGREKLAVDVSEMGGLPDRPFADHVVLCILERASSPAPELERLDSDALASALAWGAEPGFHVFREEIREAVRKIGRPGGWRLALGGHPDDALPLVDRIFAELEEAEDG